MVRASEAPVLLLAGHLPGAFGIASGDLNGDGMADLVYGRWPTPDLPDEANLVVEFGPLASGAWVSPSAGAFRVGGS